MTIDTRIDELKRQKTVMLDYLKMKIEAEDWHGVADAAMDIREIEAELRGLTRGTT